MELLILQPADAFGEDYLDRAALDRFAQIKARALGYLEASVNIPIAPDRKTSKQAPLGAVASREDAELFLTELIAEFPGIRFLVGCDQYPDGTDVVWHRVQQART